MKKLFILFSLILTLASTSCIRRIGDLTMLSNRNVNDRMDYCLKKSYTGDSKREIRKNKHKMIEGSVEKVVQSVPGGEFLRNVKIYTVGKDYYSVVGDVWGYCSEDASHKGFSVGDAVIWKEGTVFQKGTIEAFKDGDKCIVVTEGGNYPSINFKRLSKASDSPN